MGIDQVNISNRGIENHRSVEQTREARTDAGTAKRKHAVPAPGQDSVALSSTAKEIGRVAKLASGGSDRSNRINQIRQAIDDGTFRVSGEDIAKKMIEAHKKTK